MPITYNGTNITGVLYNGNSVTTVIFNGTTVFTTVATYEWVFVDVYSSDPNAEIYYEGNGSGGNISGMINELSMEYPPEDYVSLTVTYYDFDDGYYYLFIAE
jgi:TM2 domain-containing membrane protein YozV